MPGDPGESNNMKSGRRMALAVDNRRAPRLPRRRMAIAITAMVSIGAATAFIPSGDGNGTVLSPLTQPKPGRTHDPLPAPPAASEVLRARLIEEDPTGATKGQILEGAVTWRTETKAGNAKSLQDIVVIAELDITGKMKGLLTLQHNPDQSLPAAFLLKIQLSMSADHLNTIEGIAVKSDPKQVGTPLDGALIKMAPGTFLLGLLDPPDEEGRNAKLLRMNEWFDVVLNFKDGHRAVLTFEKGLTGRKAVAGAIAAWATQ